MTTFVLIVAIVAVPLLILGLMLWRLLSDMPRRGQRVAGIGPFDQLVDLIEGEHVLELATAMYRVSEHTGFSGTLAFTETRLIFGTHRSRARGEPPPPPPHWLTYDDLSKWHRVVVPDGVPSMIVYTHTGDEYVYVSEMGNDIVAKARRHLPHEVRSPSGQ